MQSIYELKRIRSSADKSLRRALEIYFQNVDPLIRTATNEIIHWLDRYNERFKDRFYLVALYLNDILIGYGQFTYFKEERVVFVDYLAIEKNSRKNNTFYEFIEKIKDFFIDEGIEYNYILTEVGYYKDKKELTEVGRNLIRLLKMTGFGVIKMDYFQPMLGNKNYETEIGGVLMIYTANDVKTLKLETFFLLIDTVYFKMYKRWYDEFLDERDRHEYSNRLTELRKKIELSAKKKQVIEINGYAHLQPLNHTASPSSKYVRSAKVLGVIIVFGSLLIGVGSVVLLLKRRFDFDTETMTFISVFSLAIIVFVSAAIFKNEPLSSAIEKIVKLLG